MAAEVVRESEGRSVSGVADAVPWTVWDGVWVFSIWLGLQLALASLAWRAALLLAGPLGAVFAVLVTPMLLIGLTLLRVRSKGEGAVRRLVGPKPPTLADAAAGVGLGLAGAVFITFVVGAGLAWLLEVLGVEVPPVQESLRELVTGPAWPVAVLGIVGLAPLAEELFFRGMLFQALGDRMRFWPAAGVSGLAFGVVHGELLVIAITAVLGVYLAVLFHRRRTLLTASLAHAMFNLLGFILIRLGLG